MCIVMETKESKYNDMIMDLKFTLKVKKSKSQEGATSCQWNKHFAGENKVQVVVF